MDQDHGKIKFLHLSSDDIRAEQMKDLVAKGKTQDQAFQATQRSSKKAFDDKYV